MDEIKRKIELNPAQVLAIGFSIVILIGAILLNLPISSKSGQSAGFLNALFTSTSAVCVTGLVVVDTGTFWTPFGKIVIMLLIQTGGLGFMSITTAMAIIAGRKISLKNRLIVQEALNQFTLSGVIRLVRYVVILTLIIEGIGALFLTIGFLKYYPLDTSLYFGVFHSVSAYCNAGFDLIGNYKSFTPFVGDWLINIPVITMIILGGLGFSVLVDIINQKNFRKLSLHSKLAITVSTLLIVIGFVTILFTEIGNVNTLKNMDWSTKILAALFQSVTPRTAGFNTVDLMLLHDSTVFFIIILMFIGASPTSTGGGIKTTTFGVIIASIISEIKGRDDVVLFKKRIPRDIVSKSLTVFGVSLTLVILITLILTFTENGHSFLNLIFETVSAFGTVGLSRNITSTLSDPGKILVIITMFAGRVGPVTLLVAISNYRKRSSHGKYRYPEGKISVG